MAARPIPGRPRLLVDQAADLLAHVQADPDATLAQHCQTWQVRTSQRLSLATMHRTIRRLAWTVKKAPACE